MKMKLRLVVFIGVLLESSYSCQKRLRRVINGVGLEDRPRPYTAIRYYGALATAHKTWYTFGKAFDFLKNFGFYGTVYCSGSLLTPAIFQTACHCVSHFDVRHEKIFIKQPIIQNHWEGRQVVYFGVSNRFGEHSMVTCDYVLTEKFIIDSKCAGLGSGNSVTHDYALVQIDGDWIHRDSRGYNSLEIDWAPQYSIREITDFNKHAQQKQLVCLLIGFGDFDDDMPSVGSDVLRYGWTALLPHRECIYETGYVQVGKRRINVVPKYFNWVCSQPFPKHTEYSGIGDSGGPLSCDNKYFALLSGIKFYNDKSGKKFDVTVKCHSLMYSLFANAINYRSRLINLIYRLQGKYTEKTDGSRHISEESLLYNRLDFQYSLVMSTGLKIRPELFVLKFLLCLNVFTL